MFTASLQGFCPQSRFESRVRDRGSAPTRERRYIMLRFSLAQNPGQIFYACVRCGGIGLHISNGIAEPAGNPAPRWATDRPHRFSANFFLGLSSELHE